MFDIKEYYKTTWNADFFEEFIDEVKIKFDTYILDNPTISVEKLAIIGEFVEYCVKESKKALIIPRGKEGKSFIEMRNEAKEHYQV